MNSLRRHLSILTLLCFAGAPFAFAVPSTPYLETMPITIIWQFNVTGAGKTRVIQPVASTTPADVAPDPIARTTTETGTPIIYSGGKGDQAFFVKQLLRKVLENYAESSRSLAKQSAAEPDPTLSAQLLANAQSYESQIVILKQQLNDQWELTAVRAPQTSSDGVATSPYWIFLTKLDSLQNRLLRGYDTGMRITPKYGAGTKTETYVNNQITDATGSYTTYFTLDFNNLYADDPLYMIPFADRATSIDGKDYNTGGSQWNVFGSGYITYNFRKTSGISGVIAPAQTTISGVGSWQNEIFTADDTSKVYVGTAPLKIIMARAKYQSSAFFPEFTP